VAAALVDADPVGFGVITAPMIQEQALRRCPNVRSCRCQRRGRIAAVQPKEQYMRRVRFTLRECPSGSCTSSSRPDTTPIKGRPG
jgi:hypothetical protein